VKKAKNNKACTHPIEEVIYPNSPLEEVVCEVRFPGNLEVECRRHEYHNLVKPQYPLIYVPHLKEGATVALTPYRFESLDQSKGFMIALNSFAYFERKYQGYINFKKEVLGLTSLFSQTYSIEKLTRFGWRYINAIPFEREDGLLPLNRFFNFQLKFIPSMPDSHTNIGLEVITRMGSGTITTRLHSGKRSDNGQEVFILDLDFALTEELNMSKLKDYISESHNCARTFFEELISDDYRSYLKGEQI